MHYSTLLISPAECSCVSQSLNSLVSLFWFGKTFFLILAFSDIERLPICFYLQAKFIYIGVISAMREMGLQDLINEVVIIINTLSWA